MPKSPITRRELILSTGGLGLASFIAPPRSICCNESRTASSSPTEVVDRLKKGNQRFVDGKPENNHTGRQWRESLVSGQNPFAVILSCADSRVPTELVFDQGFGDLFVIRNAGNIVMADVMGSIEYATIHLQTRVVVVMGHEGCGAVTAALESREKRAREPQELQLVLSRIDPAIADIDASDKNVLVKAVEANVAWTVKNASRIQKQRNHPLTEGIVFVGAVYELKTGKVRFLTLPK
jgi:carbonic anhydrase